MMERYYNEKDSGIDTGHSVKRFLMYLTECYGNFQTLFVHSTEDRYILLTTLIYKNDKSFFFFAVQ